MKQILIKIESCIDCPKYDSFYHSCVHNDAPYNNKVYKQSFPNWCPLTDFTDSVDNFEPKEI